MYSIKIKRVTNEDRLGLLDTNVEMEFFDVGIPNPVEIFDQSQNSSSQLTKFIHHIIHTYNEDSPPFPTGIEITIQCQPIQLQRVTSTLIRDKLGKYTKLSTGSFLLESTCSVCMSQFKINEGIRKLPCNHYFHKKCIDQWFIRGQCSSCPECRSESFFIELNTLS
jgi:hypothetical protein